MRPEERALHVLPEAATDPAQRERMTAPDNDPPSEGQNARQAASLATAAEHLPERYHVVLLGMRGHTVSGDVWMVGPGGALEKLPPAPPAAATILARELRLPLRLVARSPEHGSGELSVLELPVESKIEMQLVVYRDLKGTVVDPENRELGAGVSVVAHWIGKTPSTPEVEPFQFVGVTGTDGGFRFQGKTKGQRYVVHAAGAGFATSVREPTYTSSNADAVTVQVRTLPLYGAIVDTASVFAQLQPPASPYTTPPVLRVRTNQRDKADPLLEGHPALVRAGLLPPGPQPLQGEPLWLLWTADVVQMAHIKVAVSIEVTVSLEFDNGGSATAKFLAPRVWDRVPHVPVEFKIQKPSAAEPAVLHTEVVLPDHVAQLTDAVPLGTLTLLADSGKRVRKAIRSDEMQSSIRVPSGTYRLNFRSESGYVELPGGQGSGSQMVLGRDFQRYSLDLTHLGGLSVRILEPDGGPYVGRLRLRLARILEEDGSRSEHDLGHSTTGNSPHLEPLLAPGNYRLQVWAMDVSGPRIETEVEIRTGAVTPLTLALPSSRTQRGSSPAVLGGF